MNLQTFKAPSMAEALSQVKTNIGPGAVILHTRTYYQRYCLGLRRKEVVEVTAGKGLNVDRRRSVAQPLGAGGASGAATMLATTGLSGATRSQIGSYLQNVATSTANNRQELLASQAASTATMLSLGDEMKALKELVKALTSEVRHHATPQVPEELFDYYMQLIQNEVSEEVAQDIVKSLHKQLRPEHMLNRDFVQEKLAEHLEKLIPTAGPIVRTKISGPHVVALIGPTGVGKTTTIAKLAANLKLREKRKVGLITIDTYRIAAIDQLRKYADILGSPLKVVGNADDLREAVASMADCEFLLIDTAGRSPKDTLKLNELKNFLEAAGVDEVHLVLSSTANEECVELAIERFKDVRCDKIIFTKIDEAAHVGVMLNVIRRVNKSLSYITTGQDVPDDIEVGRGRRLAQLILGNL
jgi:flagellar biosynthesis protein FlhF